MMQREDTTTAPRVPAEQSDPAESLNKLTAAVTNCAALPKAARLSMLALIETCRTAEERLDQYREREFRVRRWDELFEVAQTRKIKGVLKWVAVVVKHDGKGFHRLIEGPNGAARFGVWILIVQVAAKCATRGVLADEDGPLSIEDLSLKTGCPIVSFLDALPTLLSIGWLEMVDADEWTDDASGFSLSAAEMAKLDADTAQLLAEVEADGILSPEFMAQVEQDLRELEVDRPDLDIEETETNPEATGQANHSAGSSGTSRKVTPVTPDADDTRPAEPDLIVPAELARLIDAWNSLPPNIAPTVQPREHATLCAAWRRIEDDSTADRVRELLHDPDALIDDVRESAFLHGQPWFRLDWLLKRPRDGPLWNVEKLADGRYHDGRTGDADSTLSALASL
ncbi:hypothetical protein GC176_00025 [bacterium]|nr:hypothetical protein [bacterium]